jgi:hypothetical protein
LPNLGKKADIQPDSKPNKAIDGHTHSKIDENSPVHPKAPVPKRLREMRDKRQIINSIAYQDCDQILEPLQWSYAEKLPGFRHRINRRFKRNCECVD